MFNFLKRKKSDTPWADILPINNLPEPVKYPTMPPIPNKPQKQTEFYRVGVTEEGLSTLTLIGNHGTSMTMTMTRDFAEQMIRMLQSTFKEEK
jgi:hypothetical protein